MKKRNMIAALLCSACLVAGSVNPVFADASKVVTPSMHLQIRDLHLEQILRMLRSRQ